MLNDHRKIMRTVLIFLILPLAAIGIILIAPRILAALLPFLIALVLSALIEPAVSFLCNKCKIPRQISSGICVLLVVAVLFWVVFSALSHVMFEINRLIEHREDIVQKINSLAAYFNAFFESMFDEQARQFILDSAGVSNIGNKVGDFIGKSIPSILNATFNVAKNFPVAIIYTVVMVMSTYFCSSDRETVYAFLKKLVPKKAGVLLGGIKNDMTLALFAYLRAQGIIMCVSFVVLLTGCYILGGEYANYAVIIATILALLDFLPVVGPGTVIIPWGLIQLFAGDTRAGIILLLLYAINIFARNMIEPRLVGKQIGLHPLATLALMYGGFNLFGIIGMILGPILVLVLRNLYMDGFFVAVWRYLKVMENEK